jgi:hypothetical protein
MLVQLSDLIHRNTKGWLILVLLAVWLFFNANYLPACRPG